MKKPKFLQRYLNNRKAKRHLKKVEKFQSKPEYQIKELNTELNKQKELLEKVETKLSQAEREKRLKILEQEKKEKDRTDPFKADKWKVVYDTKGQISTVYFNGQELYGVQRFSIDFDALVDGQTPCFTYEGYGSIEIITESE